MRATMRRTAFLSTMCAILVAACLALAGPALAEETAQLVVEPESPAYIVPNGVPVVIGQPVTFTYHMWGDATVLGSGIPCNIEIHRVRGMGESPAIRTLGPCLVYGPLDVTTITVPGTWTCDLKPGAYSWNFRPTGATAGLVAWLDAHFRVVKHLR